MPTGPLPRVPNPAEHRALRHLVTHELSENEARAVAVAGRAEPESPAGWEALTRALHERNPRTASVLVTGPQALTDAVLDVVSPLAERAHAWDGRTPTRAPDLLLAALPWRFEAITDLPGFPNPLRGTPPAIIPMAFSQQRVMVGPIASPAGPCLDCVRPAFEDSGALPELSVAPALFAFAAGAAGLYVRAFCARSDPAAAMSMTFDITSPRVEHRLWSCTPQCQRAA